MAKYSYFLGQNGGGGGGGDFALIKIEYPEGQPVTVTFDGDTIEAPDTSGLWMFGCEETGTYTIAITGTTAEVEVEITTQGQIESVWISPQVINYGLIYYLGNEFASPSADELRYAISTGGWSGREEVNNMPSSSYYGKAPVFSTQNNINMAGFSKAFVYANVNITRGAKRFTIGTGAFSWVHNPVGGFTGISYQPTNIFIHYTTYDSSPQTISTRGYSIGNISGNDNLVVNIAGTVSGTSASAVATTRTKNSNNLFLQGTVNSSAIIAMNTYCLGFIKSDDISGLSTYGSTISGILTNATSLFTDTTALNWMVLNCTGDFMISALSNSNFVNAMNVSPNKSILVANEHWNRFIALLSV